MLWFKRGNILIAAASLSLLSAAVGCTMRPLYSESGAGKTALAGGVADESLRARLASIAIDAPDGRFSQIVRNRLIFLLSNGAGEPSSPHYKLTLNAGYNVREAVQVNIGDGTEREGRASSGVVTAFAEYRLREPGEKGTEKIIQRRKRSVTSSFDRPRQEYANLQAEEDAKKRAAEELAESIYLSLAQTLGK